MRREEIYPELTGFLHRDVEVGPPKFPRKCPCCKAPAKSIKRGSEFSAKAIYECGGEYTPKPQIQNHTRIWWGSCGKETAQ